jgi:hypothetical protein
MAANKPDPKALRDNPAAIAEYLNKSFAKNDASRSALPELSGDASPTIDRVF